MSAVAVPYANAQSVAAIALLVEGSASIGAPSDAPGYPGWWARIATALETLAAVSTTANATLSGYLARAAAALESLAASSITANANNEGYLLRIATAAEVKAGIGVGTGDYISRFLAAATTGLTAGGGPTGGTVNFDENGNPIGNIFF